jgi:hypothetical protein
MKTIIYVSNAAIRFDDDVLGAVLDVSRDNNAACGVTGMLVFCGGNFLQVLEGPAAAVQETFDRINVDPRHRDVQVILDVRIAARQFADWAMAFSHARDRDDFDGAVNLIGEGRAIADHLSRDNNLRKMLLGFVERNQRTLGLSAAG